MILKQAKILHNPGAGEEEHNRKELLSLLESLGIDCRYSSTKKDGWQKLEEDIDFLVIAGGDGTVRKVADELLERKLIDKKLPIGLLPLGTANNIAKSLGITGSSEDIAGTWKQQHFKQYDVGRVQGIDGIRFMLEGLGFGAFPLLMKRMKKMDKDSIDTPEKKMKKALEVLHDLVFNMEAGYCQVKIDGVDHSGKYLMTEVMNIASIGPNLLLAPDADPGDGVMEIVLIPEKQREELAGYVQDKINGKERSGLFKPIRGTHIQLICEDCLLHVDDELIKPDSALSIEIDVQERRLDFLIP